jgi:hypothetical protein
MNVDSQIGCHNSGVADTRIKVNVATLSAERIGTLGRNGGTPLLALCRRDCLATQSPF